MLKQGGDMSSERILVVEDEVIVAKNLQYKLQNLGYDVPVVAYSGEDAVKKAEKTKPSIVLMDIKLDGKLDGIEAAQRIRDKLDIPCIFLTAYGDEKTIELAKKVNPYGYMLKPFNIHELHTNIQIALHKNDLEKKLKKHQEWLYRTLQCIGNAVITTDLDHHITFMNQTAEELTGWKAKKAIGHKLQTIFYPVDEKTNNYIDVISNFQDEKKDTVISHNDITLISKDGREIVIDETTAPIKTYTGQTDGYVLIFKDMTPRKNIEILLQKVNKELERRVKERTEELKISNKKLQAEILTRKNAERKTNRIKESLENIINSISEIIIAVDNHHRINYWNTSAEKLTGYKKKDVNGRKISKLSVFDNIQQVEEVIENVNKSKTAYVEKIVLVTKDYSKKIIRFSCSPLSFDQEKTGVLFVGKDITFDWESHQKLIRGQSYIVPEKNISSALELFEDFTLSNFKGLYITRSNPEVVKNRLSFHQLHPVLIRQHPIPGYNHVTNLNELRNLIEKFTSNEEETIVLVDGIHYFITKFSFEEFINTLYEINDIISNNNSILLMQIDPSILQINQMAIIENEFDILPSRKIEDITIEDELFDILLFIHEQNQNNSLVSFKKIMTKFNIVYYTTSRRIKHLEERGLVFTKKYGKTRIVHLTDKGKALLIKRQML